MPSHNMYRNSAKCAGSMYRIPLSRNYSIKQLYYFTNCQIHTRFFLLFCTKFRMKSNIVKVVNSRIEYD